MPTSQNGYSANDRSVIASYTVPGTQLKIALRKGDVSVVLLEYLRRYNTEVEPLTHNPQDLWGYAERTIRGSSTTLSNHASGTSADCRATRHGLGMVGTFKPKELAALDRLLAYFEGVLRHGKDYRGRKDPMHVEVDRGPAEVARIATKIRNQGAPATAGASSVSAPKELPLMIERPLVKGLNVGRVVCPTGSVSGLVSQSWVSVSLTGGGRAQLWCQRAARSNGAPPGTAGGVADWTIQNAERPWMPVPSGTEFIEYRITAEGPGSLLIEQKPK